MHGVHLALDPMSFKAIALAAPTSGTAEREHSRVLAAAVVVQLPGRRAGRTAFELALLRRSLRQEGAHGRELISIGEVRGRCDREVAIVDVVARPGERNRLQRLRG